MSLGARPWRLLASGREGREKPDVDHVNRKKILFYNISRIAADDQEWLR